MKTPSEINAFFEDQVLTEQEMKDAIIEGKKAKYFRVKNDPYWQERERIKPGEKVDSQRGNR